MSIGSNIRKLREEKGMTQAELAAAVAVSRSMVAQIERDSRCPTMILGRCIADALGADMKDLMDWQGEADREAAGRRVSG